MNRDGLFSILQGGFILWVILGSLWGWFFSDAAVAGKGMIGPALMLIMLLMGLTLRLEDIRNLRHAGRPLLLGVGLQFLVMPLSAWAIAYLFSLSPCHPCWHWG